MTAESHPGHDATRPRQIPWRGWIGIFRRVWQEMQRDHVTLIAAGVAFYGLLALFPAITALMALAGRVFEPSQVTQQIETVSAVVPSAAAEIIIGQASAVAGSQSSGLGLAALMGLGLAIWSSSKGVGSLIEGLNVVYDEKESRGFIHLTLLRLALTLFLIVGLIAGLGATIILPSIMQFISLGPVVEFVIGLARWVALVIMAMVGLGVVYHFAPNRKPARWNWLTPGAVLATVLWLAASAGVAYYVQNFGSYQETFGALAGVIILLMWLWISAILILLGAELNAEAEAQTQKDTTTGDPMPMGARGAVKADQMPGDPKPL